MDNRDPGDVVLVNLKDFEQYQKLFGPAAQTASAGENLVIDSLPALAAKFTPYGSRHWNSGLSDRERKEKRAAKKAERNRKRDQRRKQRR